jgi:hypothetical protein
MSVLARCRRLGLAALVLSPPPHGPRRPPRSHPHRKRRPADRQAGRHRDPRHGRRRESLAAEAGRAILAAGGSAVDAAVAVQLVLNLVEPQSSGIGGGAFLLHYDHERRRTTALDGRETAPAAAKPERFLGPDGKPQKFLRRRGRGRSVGVPGTVRLLEDAHKRYGRLPWARLFEPAIRLAEDGFAISPRLNGLLSQEQYLSRDPRAKAAFYEADGRPKAAGATLRNPAFAQTLRTLAEKGAAGFYEGPIAEDVCRDRHRPRAEPRRHDARTTSRATPSSSASRSAASTGSTRCAAWARRARAPSPCSRSCPFWKPATCPAWGRARTPRTGWRRQGASPTPTAPFISAIPPS